ncbi:MAG: SGNH/GDSL hydrolase family protein [Planctomycetota bacterium]|jgi:lysophospholipase L1-like esterase
MKYVAATVAILFATLLITQSETLAEEPSSSNIAARSSFQNSRIRFEREKRGHVAFIGGSITEMNGYRPMVCEFLQQRFPDTDFTFTAAGISSTCSTTGAFRLHSDVLSKGPVDLFFVEFAVNDDQDAAHARRECIRGLEGIIRQCRNHNPNMDIVVTYFVNPGMLKTLQTGKAPLSIAAHETVTERYSVSRIHLAREVAERISAGSLTWEVYGGTHPKPAGNRIGADMVAAMLTAAWNESLTENAQPEPRPLPETPHDENSYFAGQFVSPFQANITGGWLLGVPDWKQLPGSKRGRFTDIPMLHATTPGSEFTLRFTGRAIGAYVVAGPDAGIVEASIDGGPFTKHDLFHRFSRGLHYPRTVMFNADLPAGEHTLQLRISAEHNEKSSGTAARIIQFCVNGNGG